MNRLAASVALLPFESGSAWAAPPPRFDAKLTCRHGRHLMDDGQKNHLQGCLRDEADAQKEMIKTWTIFRADAQAMCAGETKIGGAPSYVELLTCLQLDQQGAAASLENKKALTVKPARLPGPASAALPK